MNRQIDEERGEYCLKKVFPSRVNYYFYSQELYDLNYEARVKKADKLYREAVSLQADLDKGRKLKKKFLISNDLIVATISLQTKLTSMSELHARSYTPDRTVDGREGFFCLTSNMDLDPKVIRQKCVIRTVWRDCSHR